MILPKGIFKRSAIPSKVPTTSQVDLGEIAINTWDGKLFLKKDNGTESIVEIGGISNVVEDTTPQLGGDLDLNGSDINGTGNIDISNNATTGILSPLKIAQTWNASTDVVTGITLDVTDTSSSSSSKLMDLRVGGSHKFQVDKDGTIRNGSGGTWGINQGMSLSGNYVSIQSGVAFRGNVGVCIANTWSLGFAGPIGIYSQPDTMFVRDSAGVMALRNSYVGTAQTFRIYNYSNSGITTYERASFGWTNDNFVVNSEVSGIGVTSKGLLLQTDGTTRVAITTDGNVGIGTTQPTANLDIGHTGAGSSIRLGGQNSPIVLDNTSATNLWFLGKEDKTSGIRQTSNGTIDFVTGGGANRVSISNGGYLIMRLFDGPKQAFELGYSGNKSYFGRLSENRVGLNGGTQGQTFEVYNTYTSSTNFERANVGWTTNTFIVGTEKGSAGGTARQLELQTDGTTRVAITTDGNVGIGTTQPTATLDVNGDVNITGIVTATKFVGQIEVEIINPFLLMGA